MCATSLTVEADFLFTKVCRCAWATRCAWPHVDGALAKLLAAAGVPCVCSEVVGELSRGVRAHFNHYVKQLEEHTWRDAQRGLAHSYSRAKVKFNVNRVDNMIIQACFPI